MEWRQHKDPNYELTRLEQDIGLQGIPELVDNSTQTSWFRSVNSALQYEPITMEPRKREAEMDTEKMQLFLEKMLPLVEQALQQNETLDIFLDPFAHLHEDDASLSNKNENSIKEMRSFTDLVYSKNKTLPSVDWHPKKNGVVAVAAAANVNFAKRLDLLDKIDSSFILIWNFVDLIHPQLMLEAPQDVLTLRFNPTQPHIIAAGLHNGQVMVWDFSKAEYLISKMKSKNSSSGKNGADEESQRQVPPVKPLYVSYIDTSHRRPVADLMWLPLGMEVNNRGHLVASTESTVSQFVTIAGDGQVSFWDLRFKDPKYRGLTRTKIDKGAPKDAPPEIHFIPIYSITLTKVDSAGELGLKCLSLERTKDDTGGPTLSSRFYCGTEEGELVYADWRPHAAATTSSSSKSSSANNNTDDGDETGGGSAAHGVEYVQWICRDHFRPVLGVRASPFFPSILLTASEANFHLWNVSQQKASESNGPIWLSPLSISAITCVAFSPTRPAVIYIGKADGMLEVWDFMDQSHRFSLSIGVTACALTSIEFRPHIGHTNNSVNTSVSTAANAASAGASSAAIGSKVAANAAAASAPSGSSSGNASTQHVKQQLVAIGDQMGNLHILEVPRTLSRASTSERATIEAYFKRESERMRAHPKIDRSLRDELNSGARGTNAHSEREREPAVVSNGNAAMTASTGAASAAVDDELFKRLESDFCRDMELEPAAA